MISARLTTATVSNLNDATTYFFSVTAYNSAGLESQRSSEISYTTPSPPPGTYTLTVTNGTGDGSYPGGTSLKVTVSADPPPQGQQFDIWSGDTVILDDLRSSTTQAYHSASECHDYSHVLGFGDGHKRNTLLSAGRRSDHEDDWRDF